MRVNPRIAVTLRKRDIRDARLALTGRRDPGDMLRAILAHMREIEDGEVVEE